MTGMRAAVLAHGYCAGARSDSRDYSTTGCYSTIRPAGTSMYRGKQLPGILVVWSSDGFFLVLGWNCNSRNPELSRSSCRIGRIRASSYFAECWYDVYPVPYYQTIAGLAWRSATASNSPDGTEANATVNNKPRCLLACCPLVDYQLPPPWRGGGVASMCSGEGSRQHCVHHLDSAGLYIRYPREASVSLSVLLCLPHSSSTAKSALPYTTAAARTVCGCV